MKRKFFRRIQDLWYWVRCHTYTRYHILKLSDPYLEDGYRWGYTDDCVKLGLAMFGVLCHFVEVEHGFNYHDWDYTPEHKACRDNLMAAYNFWTKERPLRQKRINNMYEDGYDLMKALEAEEQLRQALEAEEQLRQDTRYHMHMIVEYGEGMWT